MTSRLRSLSFFFNDTATTEIYTLSLHDALPILANLRRVVESHGAGLIDVVKTNVFLVSMDDFAVMNEEYAKVFGEDRKSTRLNSSHANISYAVFCLKKKTHESRTPTAPHR